MKIKYTFHRKHLAVPYAIFLAIFVILPLIIVGIYAFTNAEGQISFDNFARFITERTAISAFVNSLWYGTLTTVLCLIIAYPIAYIFASKKYFKSGIWIVLFVLPMWVNLLLRTLATKEIFTLFNMQNRELNSLIGMVYNFLPFMIMPIYTVLLKMDKSLIEAAQDLGANNRQVFTKVIIPNSMSGIMSGILMVFMPTISTFVISELLSSGSVYLLGNLINDQFLRSSAWNYGAAISFVMLIFITIAIAFMGKAEKESVETGGGLW